MGCTSTLRKRENDRTLNTCDLVICLFISPIKLHTNYPYPSSCLSADFSLIKNKNSKSFVL